MSEANNDNFNDDSKEAVSGNTDAYTVSIQGHCYTSCYECKEDVFRITQERRLQLGHAERSQLRKFRWVMRMLDNRSTVYWNLFSSC
jgi:hypothetical protein